MRTLKDRELPLMRRTLALYRVALYRVALYRVALYRVALYRVALYRVLPAHRFAVHLVGVSAVFLATTAAADTLDLREGIQIDGKIISKSDAGAKPNYIIEVDPELRIAVPQSRVLKSVSDSEEALVWYRQQIASIGEDAEAHYQLARECKAKGLLAQRDHHFQRAIEIDPNHSQARAAMEYVRDGNQWVLFADQQRGRGLIKTSGSWEVPEVYIRSQLQQESNESAMRWVKEFSKQRSLVLKQGKRWEDALAAIEAIEDPLASKAIADALEESSGKGPDPKWLRLIYVKKLAALRSGIAIKTLVKLGLFEPDDGIRTEALMQLQTYGAGSAVATYLPILTGETHQPAEVMMALRGLNYFPDQELWREYVDALITKHATVTPAGPGMQVGSNNQGGSGLTSGSKSEVQIHTVQNPGALELLRQIAPGVDYRYDQAAWRSHFADLLMKSPDDLRRDP